MLTFAVGGAGAQAEMARQFLPGVRRAVEEGRLRLTLVAGVRATVEARFREEIQAARMEGLLGAGLEILRADTLDEYFDRFDAAMARTDVLWTKPSELSFYAALGLPLVFAAPVGVHERYNRRWVRESGAGLVQRDPSSAWQWLSDWLEDGTLAGAAWSGFTRLPKHGLYRILDEVAPATGIEEG
jgi:UDP-N-acetylglucosamine:LPS N-acetylglucosamine transferase